MIKTYSQIHRTDKYSHHSSIIWPVWLNVWAYAYELSSSGLEFRCRQLNFRFRVCFKQGVSWHSINDGVWIHSETRNFPWHSINDRVWIHSETRTWIDKKMQPKAPYREVLATQLNYLACLAKWLSVRLRTKWLWVRVSLQSLKSCGIMIIASSL